MKPTVRRWRRWRNERRAVAEYRQAWRALVHLQRRRHEADVTDARQSSG